MKNSMWDFSEPVEPSKTGLLLDKLRDLREVVPEPPEANCSCHLAPPCNDCVEYGRLRETLKEVDNILANEDKYK